MAAVLKKRVLRKTRFKVGVHNQRAPHTCSGLQLQLYNGFKFSKIHLSTSSKHVLDVIYEKKTNFFYPSHWTTPLKFLVPKHEVEHDVTKKFMTSTIFRIPALKFYMHISKCTCNRIMMKKNIDFLTHLQEKLPLNVMR